jgi:hypothetical protein
MAHRKTGGLGTPQEHRGGHMRNGGLPYARASFTKLDVGGPKDQAHVEVQFNPTEFQRSMEVEYARQTVPGLPHKVLQYISTTNSVFEMELYFQAHDQDQMLTNIASRNFLESLCYPRGAGKMIDAAPPRVLFMWPRFVTMTCVVTAMTDSYTMFTQLGRPKEFRITISLEEIRQVRMLSEDVWLTGLKRGPGQLGGGDESDDGWD